jgi:hypothetical protein
VYVYVVSSTFVEGASEALMYSYIGALAFLREICLPCPLEGLYSVRWDLPEGSFQNIVSVATCQDDHVFMFWNPDHYMPVTASVLFLP